MTQSSTTNLKKSAANRVNSDIAVQVRLIFGLVLCNTSEKFVIRLVKM